MNIAKIPIVTVSYNSAELIEDLLSSLRSFYSNQIYIIDGSGAEHYSEIEAVASKYPNVRFIHFDYNIHHGPGMAWAINNLDLEGPVLILDSDVFVLKEGLIESLMSHLKPDMWGVGSVSYINEGGYDVDYVNGAIPYLHPACMLINIEEVKKWPMPVKHGAPMVETMTAIHNAGQKALLGHVEWVREDFSKAELKNYIRHDWQGTVKRTGGYHLEEWEQAAQNANLLRLTLDALIPAAAKKVVEIGAGDGVLSRSYKEKYPSCYLINIVLASDQEPLHLQHCDQVLKLDVDKLDDEFFHTLFDVDCWVLNKAFERLQHPEILLGKIHKVMAKNACIVACIPNAQHWTVQAKLCIGDFRYSDSGLMDQRNLRWFTRATMFELFHNAGFSIILGTPIIYQRLENQAVLSAIKQFALSVGADPELAVEDSQVEYFIVKAITNEK